MIEQSHFTRTAHAVRDLGAPAQRGIVVALAALLIVGGAVVWRISARDPATSAQPSRVAAAPRNPALDELVGTTKALDASQQQVVDQLQIMQDMLAAQQAETKRTSDRVAALSDKLEGLRQSFASVQQPAVEESDSAPATKTAERTSRPRASVHRAGPARKIARTRKHRTASTRH